MRTMSVARKHVRWALAVIFLLTCAWGADQQNLELNPQELVRRAAKNEVLAADYHQYFLYRDHVDYKTHSITKEVLETPQGGLSNTIAINGKLLTPEQRAKENQKLDKFANDPAARRKREE